MNPDDLSVTHLTDLPSSGDTSFAGVVPLDANAVRVFDYTSPVRHSRLPWIVGQLGPTSIFRVDVSVDSPAHPSGGD